MAGILQQINKADVFDAVKMDKDMEHGWNK